MPVLHLVSGSPYESQAFQQCLARAGEGDGVVLIGNGVYVLSLPTAKETFKRSGNTVKFYALWEDLRMRALEDETRLTEWLQIIDYPSLVELVVAYPLSQSWP